MSSKKQKNKKNSSIQNKPQKTNEIKETPKNDQEELEEIEELIEERAKKQELFKEEKKEDFSKTKEKQEDFSKTLKIKTTSRVSKNRDLYLEDFSVTKQQQFDFGDLDNTLDMSFVDKKPRKVKKSKVETKEKKPIKAPRKYKAFIVIERNLIVISGFLNIMLYEESEKYQVKIKSLQEEKQNSTFEIKNMLLGDSITFYYNVYKYFKDESIVKSAVSGYTTKDIIDNYNSLVESYHPQNIILLIGTNDIAKGFTEEETLENIDTIVKKVKQSKATIMIQSVYPIDEENESYGDENRTNEKIESLNKKLKEYCEDEEITYIDVYSHLINDEGVLKSEYTSDGLHVSDKAYEVITAILKKYIVK